MNRANVFHLPVTQINKLPIPTNHYLYLGWLYIFTQLILFLKIYVYLYLPEPYICPTLVITSVGQVTVWWVRTVGSS
jgi:hypothetical protein